MSETPERWDWERCACGATTSSHTARFDALVAELDEFVITLRNAAKHWLVPKASADIYSKVADMLSDIVRAEKEWDIPLKAEEPDEVATQHTLELIIHLEKRLKRLEERMADWDRREKPATSGGRRICPGCGT